MPSSRESKKVGAMVGKHKTFVVGGLFWFKVVTRRKRFILRTGGKNVMDNAVDNSSRDKDLL